MYQSLEAELHDLLWEAEGPAAEMPLLRAFLRCYQGRALEIGSGSGRLLLPLFQEGFAIEGLEPSREMLALCQASSEQLNCHPKLHQGDLFSLTPEAPFQAITIPAFTLQLMPDPIAALRLVHDLLAPRGGLYFSVFYPWPEILRELPEGEFYPDHQITLPGGRLATIKTRHSLDGEAQVLTRWHRYEISSKEGVERIHESKQVIRYCEEADWLNLLEASSFRLIDSFSDFIPHPPDDLEETAGVTTFFAEKI